MSPKRTPGFPSLRHRAAVLCGGLLLGLVLVLVLPGAAAPDSSSTALGRHARWAESAVPIPDGDWIWPVPVPREVTDPFRAPAHRYGPGHRGMDVAAPVGAEVRSPADGVIAFRGVVVDRPLMTIDHGDGIVTTLEPVLSPLEAGDAVEAGQVIGTVDRGGTTMAGSLHVGVRVDGEYVNPLPYFGHVLRAVLLPVR